MKKIIMILLIPLLLTGCASVNYELTIDKNLQVEEKVFLSATKEYFDSYYKNYPRTIVQKIYDNEETMQPFKNNNYKYELLAESYSTPGILVTKKYNSLNEYTNNTIFKGQAFQNIITTMDNNLVSIKTKEFLPYIEDNIDSYAISNLKITIKVPYVVTTNNADNIDKKNNVYIWNIDDKTKSKEINLVFDKNRIYIYIYDLIMYISLIILILITIIFILYLIKLRNKNKKNNQLFD